MEMGDAAVSPVVAVAGQKRLAVNQAFLETTDPTELKRFKGDYGSHIKRRFQRQSTSCAPNDVAAKVAVAAEFAALSPITELSREMHSTNLSTPKGALTKDATFSRNGRQHFRKTRALHCEFAEKENVSLLDFELDTKPNTESSNAQQLQLRSFNSLSSTYSNESNSLDDEYMALFEMETAAEEQELLKLPTDLDTLISGKLKAANEQLEQQQQQPAKTSHNQARAPVRRCLSMLQPEQQQLATSPKYQLSLKLNLSVYDDNAAHATTPIRSNNAMLKAPAALPFLKQQSPRTNQLRKSMSMNDAKIMSALARSEQTNEPKLIGDFSEACVLPVLTQGQRHCDLETISCETLRQLLHGVYADTVRTYRIVDCRYPYEYDGGHIKGAKNLYTQEQIMETFPVDSQQPLATAGTKRDIIIFHCEFSSERGPKLLRFLRNTDRSAHTNVYPALVYPELYLLHNGYKEFYQTYADLCSPHDYVPMLSPKHNEQYRYFRAKSKSWQCDSGMGGSSTMRPKKARSRLALQRAE